MEADEKEQLLKILAIPAHDAMALGWLFKLAQALFQTEGFSISDAWGEILVQEGILAANPLIVPLYDGAVLSISPAPPQNMLFEQFSARIALLVEYLTLKRSFELERQEREVANTLQDISLIISSQLDPETVFKQILEQVARVLPYDAASVWLLENNETHMIAGLGHDKFGIQDQNTKLRFRLEEDAILREIVESQRVLILSDVQSDPRWSLTKAHQWIRSWASAPIIINGQVIGQFNLDHSQNAFYNDSHLPILETLSRQMSIAAQNAKLFEALRLSQSQLQESLQVKSRFISTVSHEFRTPLAAILANSQIIERFDKRLSDEQKISYHAKIKAQVEYLNKLVEDVLLVSKGDSIGFQLRLDRMNLQAFCTEIIAEISLLSPNNLKIQLETPDDCSAVAFDSNLLRHILFNLLSNAIKYSPEGGTVRLKVKCSSKQFSLMVSDEGIGIPAEEQEKLFQNFFRASNADKIKGTGLGLTIVKRAVEAYGGKIALKSKLNQGTSIEIKLPRYAALKPK